MTTVAVREVYSPYNNRPDSDTFKPSKTNGNVHMDLDRDSCPSTPTTDLEKKPSIDLEKFQQFQTAQFRHWESGQKEGQQYEERHEQEQHVHEGPVSFRSRLRHFTWAWYTLTMSTGGLASLLASQPHSKPGVVTIGYVLYIVNLIIFTGVSSLMVLRFLLYPGLLVASLKHEREGLFLPTFFLSIATHVTGAHKFILEQAHHETVRNTLHMFLAAVFWLYSTATFLLAVIQYSYLFAGPKYPLHKMMPSWFLPVFPIMLAGTIASVIAETQPLASALPILVAGTACQGLGFSISLFMYAHLIGRLMSAGLPNREHRPALFIGVGPPSFTALAFIGMAKSLPNDFNFDHHLRDITTDAPTLRTMAMFSALFLWMLAAWFFFIALVAVVSSPPKYFHLGWWAMVFPNTGFTLATIAIGNTLQIDAVLWAGNGMTVLVGLMWCFVLFFNIRAVIVGDIMWPDKDEDVAD